MIAFSLDIDPKEADGADAIDLVNRRILDLVHSRIREGKTSKAEIARRLGVNRSTVSRLLRGNQNLTSRTIGEILGAIDFSWTDIQVEDRLKDRQNILHSVQIVPIEPSSLGESERQMTVQLRVG